MDEVFLPPIIGGERVWGKKFDAKGGGAGVEDRGEEDGWIRREDLRIGRPEGERLDVFGRVRALEVPQVVRMRREEGG